MYLLMIQECDRIMYGTIRLWTILYIEDGVEKVRKSPIFEMNTVKQCNITLKVLPFNPLRAAKVMFSKWIQTILVIISILFTAASTVNTPLINSKKVSFKDVR